MTEINHIVSLSVYALLLLFSICSTNQISIPSNCIGLSDGYYYLKLLSGDEFPIIYARCSDEYIILDPSLDPDITSYFDSFQMYMPSVAGPSNQHPINWQDWFIPNNDNKYGISPECKKCDPFHNRQLYEDKTVYMMTGSMFGCFWNSKHEHLFDQDFDTYQCYYDAQINDGSIKQQVGELTKYALTDESTKHDWDHSGSCAFNPRSADLEIPSIDHEACTLDYTGKNGHGIDYGYHLKPSIGTDGKHCVCTQPSDATANTLQIDAMELKHKQRVIHEKVNKKQPVGIDDEDAAAEIGTIYYVYQGDFDEGTYRITEPGRYMIMEDITFNPNPGSSTTDHANDDMSAWRPHKEQSDKYPGAGGYKDPYFMGFWAAITIETNNVVLDLNDHSIAMDEEFYHQQRWFTIISLTSQYFLPGQGIGFFGADPSFAENVVIKDGTLGLTSHHCIHGNFNKNILIEHIVCKEFETHGIQLNGFDHITIRNVEIGPSSTKSYFRGEYGFARALLPRLMKVADENPDRMIRFDQREDKVSMRDLTEELIRKTNLMFDYVHNGNEPITSSQKEQKDWMNIKELFYNPSGLPNGASMYGIYLNTKGENVMSYNLNTNQFSNSAVLENVKIHDLRHKMTEYIRVSTKTMNPYGSIYLNPLQAPYDATQMFYSLKSEDLLYRPRYKGTIMTDILFALSEFTDNWDYLQSQLIFKDQTLPWAKGEDLTALNENLVIGCNNDVMLQSGKGLMGIRIDGVQNAQLTNIDISNLFDETHLGSEDCGEYTKFDGKSYPFGGGHISQKIPMQVGFSGNTVQGIALNAADNIKVNDINIHSIQSHTGDALGIGVWPSVNLGITGDITINEVHAGWLIPEMRDELTWESRPNRAPMACGILHTDEFYSSQTGLTYVSNVKADIVEPQVQSSNIYGFTYCNGRTTKTMVGGFVGNMEDDGNGDMENDDKPGSKGKSSGSSGSAEGGDNANGDALDSNNYSDELQELDGSTKATDHMLVGTVIAVTILLCGFVTMGYIAYVYCQHKRQQKETEQRAQLLLQQAQQQDTINLQSAQRQRQNMHLPTFQFGHLNRDNGTDSGVNGIEEEEEHEEVEQNERTPLINQLPTFNRLNL